MMSDTVTFFDKAAGDWDKNVKFSPERIDRLLDILGNISGKRVLDVGCGTGILFSRILDRIGLDGHLTGLDPSREMLKHAREKCSDPEVDLVRGFAESLPFKEEFFDALIIFSCFPHLADPAKAIREFGRVLANNGRIVIGHASGRDHINTIHHNIGGAVSDHLLSPASAVAHLLITSGFEVDTVADDEDFYCVAGTRAYMDTKQASLTFKYGKPSSAPTVRVRSII